MSISVKVDFKTSFLMWAKKPISIVVFIPLLAFAFYQIVWASPRFQSQAQVIVQQPDSMATMDASLAILSGIGVDASNTDTELVSSYIYSSDMLSFLEEKLELKDHFINGGGDFFSRLHSWSSKEEFLNYFKNHVTVEIDEKSNVITIYAQAFSTQFAHKFSKSIVERAEWFINDIGHQLANEQIKFIRNEFELVEKRFEAAQKNLLSFQEKYNLLDPQTEGVAMQQIAYSIEGQIANKETELKVLLGVMTEDAPEVAKLKNEIRGLKLQLSKERERLSKNDENNDSISEILSKYTDYKIQAELALQAYKSSQISLEKSRVEAYRQLKYLIVVEKPTLPESRSYPEIIYNITLLLTVLLFLFGIGSIVVSTIKELS